MLNILVLDPYPKANHRICKDNAGAYGTANHYGDNFFCKFLNRLVKNSDLSPPLFAAQIIGELSNAGHNVKYAQEIDNKYYDFIVIISSIVCHETELENIKVLIQNDKNVIVAGPFATSYPDPYIKAGAKVILGEPDMFFHNFDLNIDKIRNLPSKIKNFKIYDINELSIPGWKEIFKFVKPRMKFLGKGNSIYIQSSRGCPYPCFYYCTYPTQQGRKLRFKSVDLIVNEMNYFFNELKVQNYVFRDPVFAISKKHTMDLCTKIIENGIKFNLCIETHLNNIDKELSLMLKKAGVKLIYIGIESGVKKVRDESHRLSEENDKQIEKINYLEKLGILVKANYIIGLPKDTKETYLQTLEYAKLVNSSYAQFSVFTPYPGTPAYSDYENKINTKKFEDFTQWRLVFNHNNFSKREISELITKSYTDYYLNYKWIIKYIKHKLLNFI
ncbi:radical SAM protein [Candidatus Pelagibacter sp.]|jgi:anaerobic magnesium-protoporphyrin IX monomethyl ester cyclase|nr:radical SAM protein [Candidatus Pelagibacter sp.]